RARRHPDALAEVGEVERHAQHTAVERLALLRVDGVAHPEHAADVEHLQHVAGPHGRGHVARVAEERLAMPERARDHVALTDLRHAAAGELERVVGGLVGEHLDHDDHAFLGGDVLADAHLVREPAGLGHGGELVDEDAAHAVDHRYRSPGGSPDEADEAAARSPARAWNTPASAAMRENPSASRADHSPAASPYTPRETAMSEYGDSTPSMNTEPVRSSSFTSPVTRRCEESSSASMSRHTGSSSCPSWTRSP